MRYLIFGLLTVCSIQARAEVSRDVAVIVHPSNSVALLRKADIVKIFLGRVTRFPNGESVVPKDQDSGAVKRSFYKDFFDYSLEEIANYWIREVYRGGSRPPSYQDTRDDAAMLQWVASNPSSIGYIKRSTMNRSVKEVTIEP